MKAVVVPLTLAAGLATAADAQTVPPVARPTPAPPAATTAAPPLRPPPVAVPLKPRLPPAPQRRVLAAGAAARVQPQSEAFVNAQQIWAFAPGALYQLYASPGKVSDLALQPGEHLISVSAGDTARWLIGDTTSGAGDGQQVHVLVKPTRSDLKTNMLIYTDRRLYQLELTAGPSASMASAAWRYPQDELIALRKAAEQAQAAQPVGMGIEPEKLAFRYAINGDKPAWRPTLAFDDGAKTYIQFPANIAQTELPPLFVVGPGGEAQLVNARYRAPYYVVDQLFDTAELRLGAKHQQVVRIVRTDLRRRAAR